MSDPLGLQRLQHTRNLIDRESIERTIAFTQAKQIGRKHEVDHVAFAVFGEGPGL